MRHTIHLFIVMSLSFLCTSGIMAQTSVTVSGTIKNSETGEAVNAASVMVAGTATGTYSKPNGSFELKITGYPVTLLVSSVGYKTREVTVGAAEPVAISLEPGGDLGQEVVVAASRVAERILESPVTIDRISNTAIRNMAAPNFYEALSNVKGVDLTTSSLTFRTISTRGFNGSGNLRFNQLVDGMDNQAPALNFSVGNVVGMTEMDVDNVELLSGASSALYGSGGMNGTLLMTSKNPFKYQGLSINIKQGVMHIADPESKAKPFYDWSLRWGQQIGQKFAFKLSASYMKAQDWVANDTRDLNRNNVISSLKPGGTRVNDPNYDGVNVFGDEASASMAGIAQVYQAQTRAGILQATGGAVDIVNLFNTLPADASPAQIGGLIAGLPGALQPAATNLVPFYFGLRNNVYGGQLVSRTGYNEKELVNYDAYSFKTSGGLYYKITDHIEASLLGYWGLGTTVYTGADRYSLLNFKIGQYKAELKGKNWFLRAYTTQENSGDSYTATTAALFVNRQWRSDADWFGLYSGTYSAARLQGASEEAAHAAARTAADAGRYLPGTPAFDSALVKARNTSIKDGGAKFADKSDLFHYEGQLNLSEQIKFVEAVLGASYRVYSLNSAGTIFADTTGRIKINEYGGYLQLQKRLLDDVLKLTGSVRFDKRDGYKERFTPRASAVIRVAQDNNIRLSFQTAYRFPSTQDQWINLNTPGSRLIGGDPSFINYFGFDTNPVYTSESVAAYRGSVASGTPDPSLLKRAQFSSVKPERMNSFELGYRGLLTKALLIDIYGYRSEFKDFIARVAVARGSSGDPERAAVDLASPFTSTNYSFVTNTDVAVTSYGWGLGLEYRFSRGYVLGGNFSSDLLKDVPAGFISFFNTPKYRFNMSVANENVVKNIGFNLVYRWQDKVNWEGTFGSGPVPAYGTLDGQVSYRMSTIKTSIKLGASNLLNKYYSSAFGNPMVGGLYYISLGYNL
ncbi:TonB-dependent receptor [Niabella drilacis]|uniref:TonB-dependent Receptor Plug Domain n=1 Tax=Niabella drilacis (strain DSM 25811 / CCM 8410 / CCUG 62505 / LMG 26954 / E90) TaxID=1285928 RepID=A0A1G6WZ96_NIADE|nr:TonB-dependent receptor [Niabella drilacis]SDD70366.1 TonB-dependent Receptor Plug Domain [Niabella drilacis]